jgi:hypothetical protein
MTTVKTLTWTAALALLALPDVQSQTVALTVDQPDTPVQIRHLELDIPVLARSGRGGTRPSQPHSKSQIASEGIAVEGELMNASERPIAAIRVGFVLMNLFDEHMATVYSYLYDAVEPGGSVRASADYRGREPKSLRTVLAFVDVVRFADGELWRSSPQDVVLAVERAGGTLSRETLSP